MKQRSRETQEEIEVREQGPAKWGLAVLLTGALAALIAGLFLVQ